MRLASENNDHGILHGEFQQVTLSFFIAFAKGRGLSRVVAKFA